MSKLHDRLAAIKEEATELRDELRSLVDADELTEEQEARFAELTADDSDEQANPIRALERERADVEKRLAILEAADNVSNLEVGEDRGAAPQFQKKQDPYEDRLDGPPGELRGRALKAVEETNSFELEDRNKERITHILERKDDKYGNIAKLVLATGSRDYKEAWTKAITGREMALTDKERSLLARAMSQTDGSGGFAIPFPIDPTLIQVGDGSSNPFRQISRVEQITTDTWQGLASTQMTASWDAEAAEVSDDTTTYTQPQVTAHKAAAFVPASIEIVGDYPNLVGDLGVLFEDAKMRLEATAFATGTGSGQPFGIVTAIDGTGNDISSAATDTFAVGDVYTVHETLGPRYRDRATWVANVAIINDIRQFGTADSHAFSVHLTEDAPLRVLGRPIVESSAMDGSITALADNNVLVLGDFSNYLIADRVGFNVEFIPHLFATGNNRPDGQRGFYAYWRVGADSINDDAFVLLNVT